MREILFRGKSVNSGTWFEGQYYKRTEYYGDPSVRHYIITSTEDLSYDQALEYKEVIPETVGQWTGLTDAAGKKIFEGDIAMCTFCYQMGQYPEYSTKTRVVEYKHSSFVPLNRCTNDPVVIIGNIHDNPELMEEKK